MSNCEIIICPNAVDLGRQTAERFTGLAGQAIHDTGRFTVALSGGSTPRNLYEILAGPGYAGRVAWEHAHFFWGDERCVPPEHPESNYGMVKAALLSKITIPEANVHRMAGEKDPEIAAAEYEKTLVDFFSKPGEWPRFDLMLLGVGEDGHTASLFPGSDALENTENLVVATYVEKLKAHRLTLTLPVINHAAKIWFLVAGASKAAIVREIFKDEAASRYPAARVEPTDGRLTWFITQDAAADLPAQLATSSGLRSIKIH
jgi:6-phosphogluconolactonase